MSEINYLGCNGLGSTKTYSHERTTIQYYQRGESRYVDSIKYNIHYNDL